VEGQGRRERGGREEGGGRGEGRTTAVLFSSTSSPVDKKEMLAGGLIIAMATENR